MAVQIVDRIPCTGNRLAVRIVDTNEIVLFEPSPNVKSDEAVIGWLGSNLVHVDFEDIFGLRGVLKVIGVARRRMTVIDGGQPAGGADLADDIRTGRPTAWTPSVYG